jgi:hypothetical protein
VLVYWLYWDRCIGVAVRLGRSMILCGFYSTLKMYGKKSLPAQAGKNQFMASGGPVFALASCASASNSGWKPTNRLRKFQKKDMVKNHILLCFDGTPAELLNVLIIRCEIPLVREQDSNLRPTDSKLYLDVNNFSGLQCFQVLRLMDRSELYQIIGAKCTRYAP